MCASPLRPPLICQGGLVRLAVSSIHICASAPRLNTCRRRVNVWGRRCLCVHLCFQTKNNHLWMKHSFSLVLVVILSPSFGFQGRLDVLAFQTDHYGQKQNLGITVSYLSNWMTNPGNGDLNENILKSALIVYLSWRHDRFLAPSALWIQPAVSWLPWPPCLLAACLSSFLEALPVYSLRHKTRQQNNISFWTTRY